jgi:drug/metabolite transporter superfamily protein YnfA
MTSWGNTKQRAAFWAAISLFVIAILCAIESTTGGGRIYAGLGALAFAFGMFCTVGVWTFGLQKAQNPTDTEWMDATR